MTRKIEVDVTSTVKDFYPGLTSNEIDLLSKHLVDNWDYSYIYTELLESIRSYATFNKIDLKGKDGVEAS
tara:strand:+ start:713 stop:922 length:210 start_codon:yes stop_codon:yes gene_type:complete